MHIHVYTVVLHHEKHYMSVNTKKKIYLWFQIGFEY